MSTYSFRTCDGNTRTTHIDETRDNYRVKHYRNEKPIGVDSLPMTFSDAVELAQRFEFRAEMHRCEILINGRMFSRNFWAS